MLKRNLILDIKYTFLSFIQALFSEDLKYTWDVNEKNTKIIIAYIYAVDLAVAGKRPAIILQRGSLGWSYAVRGQDGTNAVGFNDKFLKSVSGYGLDNKAAKVYTDLLRGSLSFFILSKSGVAVEEIASKLFVNLTAYQDEFRKAGIKGITGLSITPEQILKQTSEIEISGVEIQLGFYKQINIARDDKFNNCQVIVNNEEVFENFHFDVTNNGTKILFKDMVVVNPKINFIDAVTLAEHTDIALIKETDYLYRLPANLAVSGYYKILSNISMTLENDD